MIYLGLDDTDSLNSRGTGRLARDVATAIAQDYPVFGVTRHQLLVHPDIPFTSHNSCAVIHIDAPKTAADPIFETAKKLLLSDFIEGSDPGLAIADGSQIAPAVVAFGQDAKTSITNQERAKSVARHSKIRLEGLGGTCGGIIGAVAGLGLASLGNDGRFLLKGKNRELTGVRSVQEVLSAGIDQVVKANGETVTSGQITVLKNATPSFLQGRVVLFVEECDNCLVAVKRA
ncbi:MAG: ABC transporter substrate-binding protein [Candidatus Bathyarchaeota archaeon]|nr:ABC transporter substrate-binding protein [Candidatus Bathyarchaeota archaeon]